MKNIKIIKIIVRRILQKMLKYWTIRRRNDHPSNPATQRIILEIDWFLNLLLIFFLQLIIQRNLVVQKQHATFKERWLLWQIWLRKMRWLHDFVRRGKGVIILFLVLQNAFLMANFCNNFLVWIGTIMRNHYFLTFPACF